MGYFDPVETRVSVPTIAPGELAGMVDARSGEAVIKVISIIPADNTVVLNTEAHVADVMPGGRVRWKH